MDFQKRINELGLILPKAPSPVGAYVASKRVANTLYLSGQISKDAKGDLVTGKVGEDLDLEEARKAAALAALNVIAVIEESVGLDQVEGINRLVGYVQVAADFYEISKVIDGASNLFFEILGEAGRHTRSAVGMMSLPLNAAVELEATVQLKESN